MAQRHEVTLGETHYRSEHTTMATPVGEFVISFTVQPPVEFLSEQAAADMGHHVLVALNAVGKKDYYEFGREEPNYNGNHALISFSHETGDGDENVTRGVISGYDSAHPDHFDRQALQQAFDIVLNGDTPAEATAP
jgi:hypothetical protein